MSLTVSDIRRVTDLYTNFGVVAEGDTTCVLNLNRRVPDEQNQAGDGQSVKFVYDLATKEWGLAQILIDTVNVDDSGIGGGTVDGVTYFWITRFPEDYVPFTNIDGGYIKSSDVGNTWSVYTTVQADSELYFWQVYGATFKAGDGVIYQPYFGWTGVTPETGTFKIKMFKSLNGGNTWTDGPTIYSGSEHSTETSVAYVGNNKLVAVCRNTVSGNKQFVSSDNGITWSSGTALNISTWAGVWLYYDVQTGYLLMMANPGGVNLYVARALAVDIFASSQAWGALNFLSGEAGGAVGQPSFFKLGFDDYFFLYANDHYNQTATFITGRFSWGDAIEDYPESAGLFWEGVNSNGIFAPLQMIGWDGTSFVPLYVREGL